MLGIEALDPMAWLTALNALFVSPIFLTVLVVVILMIILNSKVGVIVIKKFLGKCHCGKE